MTARVSTVPVVTPCVQASRPAANRSPTDRQPPPRRYVVGVDPEDLQAERGAEHDPSSTAAGDRLIAERLHALEAEKVIQRALELEAAQLDTPHVITTSQLERIAKEIGMDPAFVHQALGEVRLAPKERGKFAQWVLPDDMIETATIEGLSREDADKAIQRWMTTNEGMMRGTTTADGTTWDLDRRALAKMRATLISGDNRISKVAGSDVAHRVHSVTETEHVVALTSDGDLPLLFAKGMIALGILIAAFGLTNAAAAGLSDFLRALPIFALLGGGFVLAGVAGARRWGQGIRGALRRALNGLVGSTRPDRKGWFARRRDRKK